MNAAPSPLPQESFQLCAFFVGAVEYAIDIMRIDEILQPQRVTQVPDAPAWVEGVMNLRGALVPVVDLRRRLVVTSKPPPRLKPKWLVTLLGRRRVALVVDGVSEVVRARKDELKPVPPFMSQGVHPAVIGAWGPPDRIRLLLNVKALLQDHRA
jgi:purine-binding chemotaxis protein CheW